MAEMFHPAFSTTGSQNTAASLMQRTRQLLSDLELKARKQLGQHFLIDAGILQKSSWQPDWTPAIP